MPPEFRAGAHTTVSALRKSDQAQTFAVTAAHPMGEDVHHAVLGVIAVQGVIRIETFTNRWGLEFQPVELPVSESAAVEVAAGRSTNGAVPWLRLTTEDGVLIVVIHWSGNWRLVTEPVDPDTVIVSVELPIFGQRVEAPGRLSEVTIAWGSDHRCASMALARHLADNAPAHLPALTEWNHWWPYEDAGINEDVFLANAAVASELGLEVAVLDAGWFGRADVNSDWYSERGDWDVINTERFPHGLAWLAAETRRRGIEFGIWIEAEAVGDQAAVATSRPELMAVNADGKNLGYVCLGSPDGRAHILRTVLDLIVTTDARWIKWDFNLDPGSGCARSDHGHQADDGLLQHYRGLYETLDNIRAARPGTILEACSSGGLRIDPGLAAHVDAFFLSDPDWTEHHLACLWGAAQMLPARQLLHWPQSEWRGEHRFQKVDYSGTLITRQQFDTKIRAAMLHRLGLSVRLTEMRPELRERLAEHIAGYRDHIRPLVETGVIVPLTDQPLRDENGCRQPAFQLTSGDDHLVAAFRLPPSGDWETITPHGLQFDQTYAVRLLDGSVPIDLGARTGQQITDGGLRADDPVETSVLWLLSPLVDGRFARGSEGRSQGSAHGERPFDR